MVIAALREDSQCYFKMVRIVVSVSVYFTTSYEVPKFPQVDFLILFQGLLYTFSS